MGSPFRSALAKLDESVQDFQDQVSRLRGGLDVDDDQLWQSLDVVHQSAATLRELVRSERPDADWADRASLDLLIQHLECEAQARRDEERRSKLLALANEFDAGTIKHRFESRAAALNALRLQAVRELRIAAALYEQDKELPGPQASEWLHWACNLREEQDADTFAVLRKDFPSLEHFAGEMEESYWVSGQPKEGTPSAEAAPPPQLARTVETPASPPVKAANSKRSESASSPTQVEKALSESKPSATEPSTTTRDSYRVLETPQKTENLAPAAADLNVSSTVDMWTKPSHPSPELPPEQNVEASEESSPEVLGDDVLPSFGAADAPKKPVVVWVAAAGIIVLAGIFAGVHYFGSGSPGGSSETVAHAAAKSSGGAPDPAGGMMANDPMTGNSGRSPGGSLDGAKAEAPGSARLPIEGAQHQILLEMELCRRVSPDSIECQGYVTNKGGETSRVTLDGVDVVDGKGNSFNLSTGGQFNFGSGRSLNIAGGSRAKYVVKVPDKDPDARTLTVYVDVNNPHGLEYTFRDVPIS